MKLTFAKRAAHLQTPSFFSIENIVAVLCGSRLQRASYGLRIFEGVSMQLLPVDCSQIEFVKRRGQSLLPLEIDPIEKSFFRLRNAIETMPCALRRKAPVKFLCDVSTRKDSGWRFPTPPERIRARYKRRAIDRKLACKLLKIAGESIKSVLSAKTGFASQLWHNFCGAASALISSELRPSPDLLQILESLEIVFLFQPAFDPEFRQDCHHLPEGNTRQFRSPTE